MSFMGASIGSTDALSKLLSRKQPIAFDHIPLAVDPFGFNRIEPGTLGRQKARQNAHAFALLLDLPVVLFDPGSHDFTLMPGGIVPDQQPGRLSLGLQAAATPFEKLRGDLTHWTSGDKAQRHLGA